MDTRRGPSWTQMGNYEDQNRERLATRRAEAELAAEIERSRDQPERPRPAGALEKVAALLREWVRR